MSIQRTHYRIESTAKPEERVGEVTLTVQFEGNLVDRSDTLLMIADAWSDAMKGEGFDPVAGILSVTNAGSLQ